MFFKDDRFKYTIYIVIDNGYKIKNYLQIFLFQKMRFFRFF